MSEYIPPPPPAPPAGPQLNYALWADRVIAALIDGLIALAAIIVVYFLFGAFFAGVGGIGSLAHRSEAARNVLGGLSCLGCLASLIMPAIVYFAVGLYNKVALVAKRGYSIGQGVAKIKVVMPNGSLVPTQTLVIRLLVQVGLAFFIPFGFGAFLDLLWPLWDERRQTLHDKAVGTYVIKMTA
jgi:uncharacterized RDD family membrane protein YckC